MIPEDKPFPWYLDLDKFFKNDVSLLIKTLGLITLIEVLFIHYSI